MSLLGVAAIVAAGSALVSGVVSSVSSNRAINQNQENFGTSMDFQREMFEKENQEYDRRFNLQADYNDPRNVAARLASIGVNPISYYTGSSSGAVLGAPSPSVQGAPSAPAAPYVDPNNSPTATMIKSVGDFVGNLAGAFKDTALGSQTSKMTDPLIQQTIAQTIQSRQEAIGKEISNIIQSKTGLSKAYLELSVMSSVVNLNNIRGEESKEQAVLLKFQQFTEQCKAELSTAEYAKIMSLLPQQIANEKALNQVYRSQSEANRASAAESSAGARLKNEQATSEKVLRDYDVNLKKWQSQEAAKRCNLSEVEFRQRLAELCQAEDKSKFLDEHPMIKRAISYLQSVGDAATLGVLKGIVTLK